MVIKGFKKTQNSATIFEETEEKLSPGQAAEPTDLTGLERDGPVPKHNNKSSRLAKSHFVNYENIGQYF